MPIQTALLSVSNKTGVLELAQALTRLNIRLLSTGGTAKLLEENGIPVTRVSDYTGFPEMMEGRVKTLHPKIHAGLLARATIDEAVLAKHNIDPIDLVVVNLYPFEHTISQPDCDLKQAIENIDIGGPTLLRAAAKNHERVTVVVDPSDYTSLLSALHDNHQETTLTWRYTLAKKAFAHTAHYDTTIASYLAKQEAKNHTPTEEILPQHISIQLTKQQTLRYGENPHQKAAFYRLPGTFPSSIASATQHQGKPLSFNNIKDADAALRCVQEFSANPACVIVKHGNPCGAAIGDDLTAAYQRAFATDPTSSFGGIIAFNQTLEANTASAILAQQFVEVIIAPDIQDEAKTILKQKPNVRVLTVGYPADAKTSHSSSSLVYQSVNGGVLVQTQDTAILTPDSLMLATQRTPTTQEQDDLLFAWRIAKWVKSNAIVLAKDKATLGIGAGQMSRIDSIKIARRKASEADQSTQHAVLASDAFFPFPDVIEQAACAGISAIIQPGGSIRDKDVIKAADKKNIAMLLTGVRHFLH